MGSLSVAVLSTFVSNSWVCLKADATDTRLACELEMIGLRSLKLVCASSWLVDVAAAAAAAAAETWVECSEPASRMNYTETESCHREVAGVLHGSLASCYSEGGSR